MQHSIQTRQRNFLWLRRKRSSLAKGATKTASARRKKNAERERPPSGQAEAGDQRWMLDFVETSPQLLSQGIFTTARFIGLTPTLPKTIGTVVRPVTMRYPLRHRPPVGWGRRLGNTYWRGWRAVMVAKCTNPSCSTAFRHLEEGTLFRLEADPTLRLSNPMSRNITGSAIAAGQR